MCLCVSASIVLSYLCEYCSVNATSLVLTWHYQGHPHVNANTPKPVLAKVPALGRRCRATCAPAELSWRSGGSGRVELGGGWTGWQVGEG